ncbi:multiple inositol polyphosphate phosphatase 1 isoform X1 [Ixodes scapularis]|uniref:multiple inositol polyphosphate phosphatase 1 isoform X1 n=1 Tax=Ixodes scapularis TaxID=6945 RepID=UPI001A9EA482|nr:multiple inositol polyphosphate phosphatase 1 isoform X1 [Ixodes scapularis]
MQIQRRANPYSKNVRNHNSAKEMKDWQPWSIVPLGRWKREQRLITDRHLTLVAALVITGVLLYLLLHREEAECFPENHRESCYQTSKAPYRLYGTKTDYRVLVDRLGLEKEPQFTVPGCRPRAFFLYNRHTTRYPDRENIVEMQDVLPQLLRNILSAAQEKKVHICETDLEQLERWKMPFKPHHDNKVTPSGKSVVGDQVRRLRRRFPGLFQGQFNASDFVVGYTSRERTRQTAEAFLEHLLSKQDFDAINFGPPQDSLLQFHKECNKLIKEKKSTPVEVDKFEKGPYMKRLLDTMSWRLGFNVTRDDVDIMYRACVFEYAIHDASPWCAAFDEAELKAIEFREDLDDYYKDAYGLKRNYAQACPIVRELVGRFRNVSKDPSQPTKLLYFSHAGGFKKVVARLGLYRDAEPPLADGLCRQSGRAWQSSLVCPFNANLAFVLFECTGGGHQVATFLNEEVQRLPGCPSESCPLETFLELYDEVARDCNVTEICSA